LSAAALATAIEAPTPKRPLEYGVAIFLRGDRGASRSIEPRPLTFGAAADGTEARGGGDRRPLNPVAANGLALHCQAGEKGVPASPSQEGTPAA
jgi:hypothetical protein